MNYMTLGKTLYKAAVFGVMLAAVFALSMPVAKVMAVYETAYDPYQTSAGNLSDDADNYGYSSGSNNDGWNSYGPGTNAGNGAGNGNSSNGSGNTCGACPTPNDIAPDIVPVVSTEPAINILKTSALIQGAAHVDSGRATVWFEWGTRVDRLDNTTRTVRIDNMSTGSSEMLTNLTPGTKYFYRVVAHNSTGTCKGLIRSFVTKGGAVIGGTKSVSNTSSTTSDTNVSSGDIKGNLSAAAANASGNASSSRSGGFVPGSIFGWLLVMVLVFAVVVTVRKIQTEAEQRKKAAEAKKKLATA